MSTVASLASWKKLVNHADEIKDLHLRDLIQDSSRCEALCSEFDGITMDYSRENVTTETIDLLCNLAKESGVENKIKAMSIGTKINETEGRAVLHMALRAPASKVIEVDGKNVVPDVHNVLSSIKEFVNRVRNGIFVGATGKKLTNIIAIGIGGSALGPEFVSEALKTDPTGKINAEGRTLKFLANVDPVDCARAMMGVDFETTLVIVVSKTFTTAETMLNARTVKDLLLKNIKADAAQVIKQHVVAVSTAISKAVDFGIDEKNIFGF